MERRISERKPVDVNVYVSQAGHSAVCCKATDISKTGVFLNSHSLYMSTRRKLELVFALPVKSSNVVRMRHVSALVTRTDSNGVGMVFCGKNGAQPHRR